MLDETIINGQIDQIYDILRSGEHQIFQWTGLGTLKERFMEDVEPFASEPQYRRFRDAMVLAETAVLRRLNN